MKMKKDNLMIVINKKSKSGKEKEENDYSN